MTAEPALVARMVAAYERHCGVAPGHFGGLTLAELRDGAAFVGFADFVAGWRAAEAAGEARAMSGEASNGGHADEGAVQRPVERPEPERDDWQHLKRYGYAPGRYMSKCSNCERVIDGLDKRAVTCKPCAEALHTAWSKPPCQQCGAMTPDEATSRCMGARCEGACHGTELWPDH